MSEEQYWEERCKAAERFIEESPCDPDITNELTRAYNEWTEIKNRHKTKLKHTVNELVGSGMIDLFNKVQAGLPNFNGDLGGMLDVHYEDIKDNLVDLICEAIESEQS